MDANKLASMFKLQAKKILAEKKDNSRYRAASYARAAEVITNQGGRITATVIDDLALTDYMKNKAKYFLSNKPTQEDKSQRLLIELTDFMGIGQERAERLIKEGLKTINQLHTKKWMAKLPDETKMWMQLKPIREIPNADIKQIDEFVSSAQHDNFEVIFVGSYRRGKATSRDIDVMIVSTDKNIISKYLEYMKMLFHDKAYPYSKGADKMSIIVDVSQFLKKKNAIYKMDVFRVHPEDRAAMLLYSTGSKDHNIFMRSTAKKQGMLLNQNGLFRKVNGENVKVDGLDSEEAFFQALGLEYKEPSQRI